jgi:hypothetical protein
MKTFIEMTFAILVAGTILLGGLWLVTDIYTMINQSETRIGRLEHEVQKCLGHQINNKKNIEIMNEANTKNIIAINEAFDLSLERDDNMMKIIEVLIQEIFAKPNEVQIL